MKLGDRRVAARTRDISRSGICLISPEEIPAGSDINVALVLALGENAFSEPLTVQAHVVWCTKLFGSHQVGAMFAALTEERSQFLEMFLRFLDGTLTPEGFEPQDGENDDDEDDKDDDDKDDPFRP